MLVPKLFTTLQTYTRDQFIADLTAGMIVGVVALPLLSEVHAQPLLALARSGLLEEVGEEYVCDNVDDALAAGRKHLSLPAEEG
jgi:hypothetical protein